MEKSKNCPIVDKRSRRELGKGVYMCFIHACICVSFMCMYICVLFMRVYICVLRVYVRFIHAYLYMCVSFIRVYICVLVVRNLLLLVAVSQNGDYSINCDEW